MSDPKLIDNDEKRRDDDDDVEERPEREKPEKASVESADSGEVVVRQTRKERHAERGFKARLEAETRAKDEEISRMRQEIARINGMTEQMQRQLHSQSQQQQSRSGHPLKASLNRIWERQIYIQGKMAEATSQSERDNLLEQWKDLELEKREEEMKYYAPRLAPQQQQRETSEPHVAAETVILRNEFPKVWANQNALQYAAAVFAQLKLRAQHTGSGESLLDLQREALSTAAQTYGIDATPAPSPGVQARYGAVSSQAGGTRSGTGEVRLSADQQRLARALYPQDSDNVAFAKWAKLWSQSQSQNQD